MATPPSDETRMLFKLLSDGEWHSYEQVRDEVAKRIPPGRALRKYEERLRYHRQARNDPDYNTAAGEAERLFYGAKALAQSTVTSWKGRGIESRGPKHAVEIRIRPGFDSWGLVTPVRGPETPVEGEQVGQVAPEAHGASEGAGGGSAVSVGRHSVDEMERRVAVSDDSSDQEWSSVDETAVDRSGAPLLSVTDAGVYPPCQRCGLPVADKAIHEQWHEAMDEASASLGREEMALLDESALRTLLGDIIDARLDAFQRGMHQWLSVQFTQLEAFIATSRRPTHRWVDGSGKPKQGQ